MGRLSTILCLSLFALAVTAQKGKRPKEVSADDGKIVGGQAVSVSEMPWIVGLRPTGRRNPFCGGSIIKANWVLTAAHCLDGQSASGIEACAGTSSHTNPPSNMQCKRGSRIHNHPSYRSSSHDHDIGLLEVASGFQWTNLVRPARLSRREPSSNEILNVAGWGATSEGGSASPHSLQQTHKNIVSRDSCRQAYRWVEPITNNMFCAMSQGRDSCQGDSGGPATISKVQYGVVSFGVGCARRGYPGVYANVARYISWIEGKCGALPQ